MYDKTSISAVTASEIKKAMPSNNRPTNPFKEVELPGAFDLSEINLDTRDLILYFPFQNLVNRGLSNRMITGTRLSVDGNRAFRSLRRFNEFREERLDKFAPPD